MENKSKKLISIGIAFLMCCFLVCGNNALASNEKQPNYDEISRQIAKDAEKYHIPGMAVIVVNADNILFQETYGNCDSIDTPFLIGSMSKSFTALAVMQLVEDGKIDLNSSISAYIDASKWFADSADCNKITVRNLLNQTSGIATYQTFGELKSTDSYGSHVYANVNYGLLGLIVEAVSGISYDEYIANNIFTPLGMEHSAATLKKSKENGLIDGYRNYFGIPIAGEPDYPEEIKDGTWMNIPAGYLSSSISDIGRYLQMYLNDGENIISKESIDIMRHIVIPIILLCIPLIVGIPFKVIWLFVKDLCLVLYINAGILITIGIYKLIFCCRKQLCWRKNSHK
ncbi:MAG: beta-lactamase family protein [Butyrivibrio sp.]|nr:beta-lactamase family protein [Butyrivibrio sp.]